MSMMNFHALAWMTSVVAHGKTMMARAIFRPRNSLFRIRASINPSRVDSTTTATVQTMVFFRTSLKAELCITLVKLAKPEKPLMIPALLTSLSDIRKTKTMGIRIKTAIRIMLGRIQI